MKFCGNCGQQIDDNAAFCPSCGAGVGAPAPVAPQAPVYQAPVQPEQPVQQAYAQAQQPVYIPDPVNTAADNSDPYPITVIHKGFWWLGFIFIGLIFYFIFKNTKPRLARSAMKGFITGAIVWGAIWTTSVMISVLSSL